MIAAWRLRSMIVIHCLCILFLPFPSSGLVITFVCNFKVFTKYVQYLWYIIYQYPFPCTFPHTWDAIHLHINFTQITVVVLYNMCMQLAVEHRHLSLFPSFQSVGVSGVDCETGHMRDHMTQHKNAHNLGSSGRNWSRKDTKICKATINLWCRTFLISLRKARYRMITLLRLTHKRRRITQNTMKKSTNGIWWYCWTLYLSGEVSESGTYRELCMHEQLTTTFIILPCCNANNLKTFERFTCHVCIP